MRSEEETEKKVELLASVATALARYDFPVPGGPKSRMPLHGVRLPEKQKDPEEKFVFKVVLISVYDCLLGLNRMKRLETYSTCEKVRKFDGQDDCFLQSFLSSFQPSNIIPPHIGFLHYNSTYTHKNQ